jgi:hypothetical protein
LNDSLYVIRQNEQTLMIQKAIDRTWQSAEESFPMRYQSNVTNIAVEQIVNEGKTDLTPYCDSMKLHLPLLELFMDHYRRLMKNNEIMVCPIT